MCNVFEFFMQPLEYDLRRARDTETLFEVREENLKKIKALSHRLRRRALTRQLIVSAHNIHNFSMEIERIIYSVFL